MANLGSTLTQAQRRRPSAPAPSSGSPDQGSRPLLGQEPERPAGIGAVAAADREQDERDLAISRNFGRLEEQRAAVNKEPAQPAPPAAQAAPTTANAQPLTPEEQATRQREMQQAQQQEGQKKKQESEEEGGIPGVPSLPNATQLPGAEAAAETAESVVPGGGFAVRFGLRNPWFLAGCCGCAGIAAIVGLLLLALFSTYLAPCTIGNTAIPANLEVFCSGEQTVPGP